MSNLINPAVNLFKTPSPVKIKVVPKAPVCKDRKKRILRSLVGSALVKRELLFVKSPNEKTENPQDKA